MRPEYLSTIRNVISPGLANHLWQSTLFAVGAGLLAVILRRNHARVRYWLWLVASVKFLIPFSWLVGDWKAADMVQSDVVPRSRRRECGIIPGDGTGQPAL